MNNHFKGFQLILWNQVPYHFGLNFPKKCDILSFFINQNFPVFANVLFDLTAFFSILCLLHVITILTWLLASLKRVLCYSYASLKLLLSYPLVNHYRVDCFSKRLWNSTTFYEEVFSYFQFPLIILYLAPISNLCLPDFGVFLLSHGTTDC